MDDTTHPPLELRAWKAALAADAARVAARDRWGRAFIAIGWTHLAIFLGCQALYRPIKVTDPRFLALWVLDVIFVVGILRLVAGPRWYRASPGAALVVRVWATFLILSFNVMSLNVLTGWAVDWFKPVWAALSSFGFAMMAWLFGVRFLVPAVQMYFTGLLMVRFPHWNYTIYGVSWCAALQGIGWSLERLRAGSPGQAGVAARWSEPSESRLRMHQ